MRRILGGVLAAMLVTLALTALTTTGAQAASVPYLSIKRVIGKSVQGRNIMAYYRGYQGATRVVVLLGQMHGDESAGINTARFTRDHLKPKPGTGVWIIPTMNPDGWAANTRQNAHGVDLNRNWPTNGWVRTSKGYRYWGGASKGSEPETKAMMAFLSKVKPTYITSIHQPLNGVGRSSYGPNFQRRLSKNLGLGIKTFGVGTPSGKVSPTLTGWYNATMGKKYAAITVEFPKSPSHAFQRWEAGRAILRAELVYQ